MTIVCRCGGGVEAEKNKLPEQFYTNRYGLSASEGWEVIGKMAVTILFRAALWIWFLGCTTTYRFGKYILVEGMGVKSAEFAVLCLYSAGLILCLVLPEAGRWILLAILVLWFVVEFFCHWYFTIFGASEKKLKGYNDCFRNTVRIFPMSETRLVPDLYHIVQHALILINAVLCVWRP